MESFFRAHAHDAQVCINSKLSLYASLSCDKIYIVPSMNDIKYVGVRVVSLMYLLMLLVPQSRIFVEYPMPHLPRVAAVVSR